MTCAMPRVCMQDTDSRTRPSIPMSAPMSEESETMSVMGYVKKLLQGRTPLMSLTAPLVPLHCCGIKPVCIMAWCLRDQHD